MNRRRFVACAGTAGLGSALAGIGWGQVSEPPLSHRLPTTDKDYQRSRTYIEEVPIRQYHWASDRAVEAFKDIKFGLRIHWGIYSIFGKPHESWPFLTMTFGQRQKYNEVYKTWSPREFDAEAWMDLCQQSGLKMFAFTTKHHEGFSMYDTRARVMNRTNWTAPGGPKIEPCDLAYSIMETPFRRDVVGELTSAAHKRNIKVDLYYSHSDWYDADFRPYGYHPLQVPSAAELCGWQATDPSPDAFRARILKRLGGQLVLVPDPTPQEVQRMVNRHRTQLTELLTRYGTIDMMCLDIFWGPKVWPYMRDTLLRMRELQPDVMLRARGIGNYGDYYTPEDFVPASKEATEMPWFVIYPLGSSFSYDPLGSNYKGTNWIIHTLIDTTAKGGNLMVGVGPNGDGSFHPTAVEQLKAAGRWLQTNGEGIYATRPLPGDRWTDGANLRFTRSKDNKTIYCHALQWPGSTIVIPHMEQRQINVAELLGYPGKLPSRWDATRGLVIDLPEPVRQAATQDTPAWTFRLTRSS